MLFYQPSEGYCFNSDTIFLFDFALHFKPRGEVLDLGCGCGVLGLLLAKNAPVQLCMVEKQEAMAAYAARNIAISGIDAQLHVGDFLETQWGGRFDFIVSNPPFYGEGALQSAHPVINGCRYSHHLPLELMIQRVRATLANQGKFVFCYDSKQLPRVLEVLVRHKLAPEVLRCVHPKAHRDSTIFLCMAKKGSKSPMKLLPPLVVFEGDAYTSEARAAFARAATHSIKCEIA